MLPGGISADLNHSQTAACFKSQPCRFHISLIYFIWRQTVAGFRRDGWDQWAVVLPTVDQFFIRQTHSIIVENLPFRFSVVSFSLRRQRHPLSKKKSSVSPPACCTASSYHWYVGDGLGAEQLGCAYMIIWDAKLQAWRQDMARTPLFHCSYCVALCVAWRSQLTV